MSPQNRRRHDRITAPDRLEIQGALAADQIIATVDTIAADLGRKWGEGRLVGLVAPDLARRFGERREQFEREVAREPPDLAALAEQARLMRNGWLRLDHEATAAGCAPASPDVWEFEVDGKLCALVRDPAHAAAYVQAHPERRVYTLDEIARVLAMDAMRLVNATKDMFPGATIKPPRSRLGDMLNDEIPFAPETR